MGIIVKSMVAVAPKEVLGLEDIRAHFPNEDVERIASTIGVKTRHISKEHSTLKLAYEAGRYAMEKAGMTGEELEGIIVVTQSPEYRLPSTACILQDQLHLKKNVLALDLNLGCSGFPYGYLTANSLIQSKVLRSVLLICGDVTSINASPEDSSTYPLFADGFGAVILKEEATESSLLGSAFGTDGSGWSDLIIHTGLARHRTKESFYESGEHKKFPKVKYPDYVTMDGTKIFTFALRSVPAMLEEALNVAKLSKEEIDCFCFHQANGYLVKHLSRKLTLPEKKVPMPMEHYGNTSSSSAIFAACDAYGETTEKTMVNLAFITFGVGLSYSTIILRVPKEIIGRIREV